MKREAPVILDIDATLVEVHSENKDGTASTYKRGFGFHPMVCFAEATGEPLAVRLRPGNAAANNAADHLAVLDDAIAQQPAETVAGHRPGDPAEVAGRPVVVRADSAGCTAGFVAAAGTATSASRWLPGRPRRSRRRSRDLHRARQPLAAGPPPERRTPPWRRGGRTHRPGRRHAPLLSQTGR
jgi:hypothetical protein